MPKNLWYDAKGLASRPLHFTPNDLRWVLPLAAATGVFIGTDHHVMTLIHSNPSNRSASDLVSNTGLAAMAGVAGLSYGIGALTRNERLRETGLLTAEAFTNTFFVTEAMKIATSRDRPDVNLSRGLFWKSSPLNSSFPSQHSALAWTAATIIAREYPGPLAQWSAYGLASLVSLSRVTGEKHFPSDILIGAATGYLIGRYVYRTHHDDRLSDRDGSTPTKGIRLPRFSSANLVKTSGKKRGDTGSPYVPLDSWIYPALKRLAALGYVPDQTSNIMPWTRLECLYQAQEAEDFATSRELRTKHAGLNTEALRLISDLLVELKPEESESNVIRLESLYTRVTEISGSPLRDGYHFGQTISNDWGRPYDRGFNNTAGLSVYGTSGRFFAYVRGEYHYAPGRDTYPLSVRQFIAGADSTPLQGPQQIPITNTFQTEEMYAGIKLGLENITFGKQNLWWGPGEESAFSFSTNAQPFYMLRFAQAAPIALPGPLARLGKFRTEFFFGKLSGHHWPPRPYVNAQKISLDLTENFELGFTRSAFFGGVGHPLTLGSVGASLFSTNSSAIQGRSDPGDRHSGFDFRYRLPLLRRYVTVYSDSYADDDPSPLDNPKRSAWGPGIYVSQIPGLRRLDLRFETYSTWLYRQDMGGNFIYINGEYADAYTNNGLLLGSWIGRDSRAYVASSTYWFSTKSKLQVKYKQIKAGTKFLPGGGTQTDASVSAQWAPTPEWTIAANAQYERYNLPVVGGPEHDLLGSLQITFTPRNWITKLIQ